MQEEAVNVDTDGRRVMRERDAIRILQAGGKIEDPCLNRSFSTDSVA
jgi:hypothetical protein